MAFAPAISHVRACRPSVCPNLGFELQLKHYQATLEEKGKEKGNHGEKGNSQKQGHHNQREPREKEKKGGDKQAREKQAGDKEVSFT